MFAALDTQMVALFNDYIPMSILVSGWTPAIQRTLAVGSRLDKELNVANMQWRHFFIVNRPIIKKQNTKKMADNTILPTQKKSRPVIDIVVMELNAIVVSVFASFFQNDIPSGA